jgi:hypothetical protein
MHQCYVQLFSRFFGLMTCHVHTSHTESTPIAPAAGAAAAPAQLASLVGLLRQCTHLLR